MSNVVSNVNSNSSTRSSSNGKGKRKADDGFTFAEVIKYTAEILKEFNGEVVSCDMESTDNAELGDQYQELTIECANGAKLILDFDCGDYVLRGLITTGLSRGDMMKKVLEILDYEESFIKEYIKDM